MNITVYLFGEFSSGYTQYPDDNTKAIFQKFYANSTAETQIAIHRSGNLMYYGYVRKLREEKDSSTYHIGICVLLNGVMMNNISNLFSLFESTVTDLVVSGEIIQFSDSGNIVSRADKLYENIQEIERISEYIRNSIIKFRNDSTLLPPVNYGVANDEVKCFSIEDDNNSIIEATSNYGFTYIFKSQDFDSHSLKSYKGVLKKLSKEKDEISDRYNQLSGDFQKVQRQKKQYRNIFLLCLLVVSSVIGLLILNDNLNGVKQENSKLTREISDLNGEVAKLQTENNSKQNSIDNLKTDLSNINSKIDNIKSVVPIVITDLQVGNMDNNGSIDIEFGQNINSSSTMYLAPKLFYKPISSGSIKLFVKLFRPNGELSSGNSSPSGYSTSAEININSLGESSLSGWGSEKRGHWSSGRYRYEIWYNDRILFSKSFTIY